MRQLVKLKGQQIHLLIDEFFENEANKWIRNWLSFFSPIPMRILFIYYVYWWST